MNTTCLTVIDRAVVSVVRAWSAHADDQASDSDRAYGSVGAGGCLIIG